MQDPEPYDNEGAARLAGHGELDASPPDWPPGVAAGPVGELAWRRLHERALRDVAADEARWGSQWPR